VHASQELGFVEVELPTDARPKSDGDALAASRVLERLALFRAVVQIGRQKIERANSVLHRGLTGTIWPQ